MHAWMSWYPSQNISPAQRHPQTFQKRCLKQRWPQDRFWTDFGSMFNRFLVVFWKDFGSMVRFYELHFARDCNCPKRMGLWSTQDGLWADVRCDGKNPLFHHHHTPGILGQENISSRTLYFHSSDWKDAQLQKGIVTTLDMGFTHQLDRALKESERTSPRP